MTIEEECDARGGGEGRRQDGMATSAFAHDGSPADDDDGGQTRHPTGNEYERHDHTTIVKHVAVASRGPGSGAVVAFLLWEQAVGGSNPPSPTNS